MDLLNNLLFSFLEVEQSFAALNSYTLKCIQNNCMTTIDAASLATASDQLSNWKIDIFLNEILEISVLIFGYGFW
jgi:hypothetical protein